METTKLTPMMQQYLLIKERHRDAILFFRLGDFYEMFFEDAETASRILDITLTSRNKNEESAVPLCGVPYHAAEPYIRKLLEAGHKVAVCEQVEDPKIARSIVQRQVVRIVTPGTITAAEGLNAGDNNFLVAVYKAHRAFGLASADITTGEFRFTQFLEEQSLLEEIGRIKPSEILVSDRDTVSSRQLQKEIGGWAHLSEVPESSFSLIAAKHLAGSQEAAIREGEEWEEGVRAASAILSYLETTAPECVKVLRELEPYAASAYLVLDETTRRNLELITNYHGDRKGSLLSVLDRTLTPMGARRLRQWILYPLLDVRTIHERLDGVHALVENFQLRHELKAGLRKIQDLERLAGRVAAGSALPRDLVAIRLSLSSVSSLREALEQCQVGLLAVLREKLADLPGVVELIQRSITDDPPLSVNDGGFIRQGFDPELDDIRATQSHDKDWIAQFEAAERRRTGIHSLKVRYNRVFGYYIEVTKANLDAVPPDYIRKQTIVNGERYITPELKEHEAKVLNSENLIEKVELALLARVREEVATHYTVLKETSGALATLDVLLSLAEVSESHHFYRPRVDDGLALTIREGRHPVVEAVVGRGAFVPNDCHLHPESDQILMLTGPNMAGKSTYMRQAALIVILAQMGSFVPAAEANIGVVDRVFTRIGAADSLARGESTFMVEMKETAQILRYATSRSLILLDEVGRGTSTFDGISIAWAVAECLHDSTERPRTLFATHYHELTDLTETKERIKNYTFAVKEWKGDVIFLRSLVKGAANHSHGIHVARLAGLPSYVIDRAKEILKELEAVEGEKRGRGRIAPATETDEPMQMALFGSVDRKLRDELKGLDVSRLTPMDALNLLHKLSEEANK